MEAHMQVQAALVAVDEVQQVTVERKVQRQVDLLVLAEAEAAGLLQALVLMVEVV
jgi:hypothetical protein